MPLVAERQPGAARLSAPLSWSQILVTPRVRRAAPLGVTRTMARRGSNLFKRNDLRRAIRGAHEAGLSVDSFEIGKDGKIVIHTRKGDKDKPDDVDVEQWLSKHHAHQR
jgi:hypothetical protein